MEGFSSLYIGINPLLGDTISKDMISHSLNRCGMCLRHFKVSTYTLLSCVFSLTTECVLFIGTRQGWSKRVVKLQYLGFVAI
jgi:hypothetical protein